jgi:3D-(3,5/4)-trihydroxycyclohexane-1,2-dione acylhydrolase (decyclizing)
MSMPTASLRCSLGFCATDPRISRRHEIVAARSRDIPSVIVIDTDPVPGTGTGGHWWDVAVPQAGGPDRLEKARERYHAHVATQRLFD